MKLTFPRLCVILDQGQMKQESVGLALRLAEAGVELFQLRDKRGSADDILRHARDTVAVLRPLGACLIVNDRADIAAMAGAAGVHVGQEDLSPEDARAICGSGRWVGVSTHNLEQVSAAAQTSAEYIAIGPIFPTQTKENPDPVVGLELIRKAKGITAKPIVAIGGVTLERYRDVLAAGADCAAVARDILASPDPVGRARAYLGGDRK
jgi:thiamine-phosphate pyrophosphorylase